MNRFVRASGALALLGSLVLSGSSLAGCMTSEGVSSATLTLPDAQPLAALAEDAWSEAPPDCEGLLTSTVSFRVASIAAGLVAAVDTSGAVVCVDSVESVQSDLDASGRRDEAEALAEGFIAAVHAEEVAMAIAGLAADPEPQPNQRPRGIGDPEPQPN